MGKMSRFCLTTLICIFLFVNVKCYDPKPGPLVIATKGEIWPKPQQQETGQGFYVIRPQKFRFQVIGYQCQILENAIQRYWTIISKEGSLELRGREREAPLTDDAIFINDPNFLGYLDNLELYLSKPCENNEYPSFDMDEEYDLVLNSTVERYSVLTAKSIWGILKGMETFSQLIYMGNDQTFLRMNTTTIHDYPRFPHRGLLLDTSRHYIPVRSILKTLDAMSYNKLNVFHWHITDDQSFPYQSRKFPELSDRGAYHPVSRIYSPTDVKNIIEYARLRGIRIIPEFDTPGHTMCWGLGIPALLPPCYTNGVPNGLYGPMDPTRNFTYSFLEDFFDEIVDVFPEKFVHLGGDEVEFDCWKSNPNINDFMTSLNISGNYEALESYYIQRLINIVDKLNASSLVWEEVFINGVKLPNDTVVHVWRLPDYMETMNQATKAGKPVLLSACWYLDHLAMGGDWIKYYECEPYDFPGSEAQKQLVLGGEACMWSEVVNENNVESRVWPRASAAAEKLWSAVKADNVIQAAKRLEEHTCRMNRRGIRAQPPNASGVCL